MRETPSKRFGNALEILDARDEDDQTPRVRSRPLPRRFAFRAVTNVSFQLRAVLFVVVVVRGGRGRIRRRRRDSLSNRPRDARSRRASRNFPGTAAAAAAARGGRGARERAEPTEVENDRCVRGGGFERGVDGGGESSFAPSATSSWHDTGTNAAPSADAAAATAPRLPIPADPWTRIAVRRRSARAAATWSGGASAATNEAANGESRSSSSSSSSLSSRAPFGTAPGFREFESSHRANRSSPGEGPPAAIAPTIAHEVHSADASADVPSADDIASPNSASTLFTATRTTRRRVAPTRSAPVPSAYSAPPSSSAHSAPSIGSRMTTAKTSPGATSLGVWNRRDTAFSTAPPRAHGSEADGGTG